MSIQSWFSLVRDQGWVRMSPVLCWALLLGVLTHVAGFLIFRVETRTFPGVEEHPPFLVFLDEAAMEAGSLASERAQLFDSAPLFIPTQWNAAAKAYTTLEMPAAENFSDYRPEIALEEEIWPSGSFGLNGDIIESPMDLLALRFLRPFRTFGQESIEAIVLPAWEPFATVRVVSGAGGLTGATPETRPLSGVPEAPGVSRSASYTLQLSADGRLLSRPILLESSGRETLDDWALSWLMTPGTQASLPAGRLEVSFFF